MTSVILSSLYDNNYLLSYTSIALYKIGNHVKNIYVGPTWTISLNDLNV